MAGNYRSLNCLSNHGYQLSSHMIYYHRDNIYTYLIDIIQYEWICQKKKQLKGLICLNPPLSQESNQINFQLNKKTCRKNRASQSYKPSKSRGQWKPVLPQSSPPTPPAVRHDHRRWEATTWDPTPPAPEYLVGGSFTITMLLTNKSRGNKKNEVYKNHIIYL